MTNDQGKRTQAACTDIRDCIMTIPDFPKPGIMYRDITSLLLMPEVLNRTVEAFHECFGDKCNTVGAVESRGFIFGSPLACRSQLKLALIRKQGALPRKTVSKKYNLEYGSGELEIHTEDIKPGDRVVLIDDLIATGGTLRASVSLVRELGAEVVGAAAVIDLPDLGGSESLRQMGVDVLTLAEFEGD